MASKGRQDGNENGNEVLFWINSCSENSAQCLPHIIRSKSVSRKFAWILLILTLVSVWLFHSYTTVSKYLKYDVNVGTEIVSARQLPNPAVTVCNKNAYDGKAVKRFIEQMSTHTQYALNNNFPNASLYGPSWFPAWYHAYTEAHNTTKVGLNDNLNQLFAELADTYGRTYGVSFRNFTVSYEKFVRGCQYEREPCKKKGVHHTITYSWLYGNCFTFIVKKNATRTGPRFGLQLTLFIDEEKYSEMTTNAGVQVVVHPVGQMPFPDEDGISVPPGQSAFIGVRMYQLERLDGKYGNCFDESKQADTLDFLKKFSFNSSYSLRTCELSCFQKRLMDICDCLDSRFPPYITQLNDSNYNSCISHYLEGFDFSNGLPDKIGCKDNVSQMFYNFQLGCDKVCGIPCKPSDNLKCIPEDPMKVDTKYESSVSYAGWPSTGAMDETRNNVALEEAYKMSVDKFRRNFLEVSVFYQNFNYELSSETQAVSIYQMLSDLGGNLGLYIGASLFTFFEFSQFLLDTVVWCSRPKSRNTGTKEDQGNESMPSSDDFCQVRL